MTKEIENYLAWKGTYAPRACTNYRIWLERFNEKTRKPLEQIRMDDLIKFNSYLRIRYQPTTVQFATIIIKNFFKYYKLQGFDCMSPENIKIPKATANSYKAITSQECKKLLSVIDLNSFVGLQKYIMIRMLFETGIRVSELSDLNIASINTDNQSAIISTKKTVFKRRIVWGREVNTFLKRFLTERKSLNSKPALFVGIRMNGEVTERMTPRSIQRMIKSLCEKAELINKITPHSFRHAKAHRILESGGNPKDVQAILGHVNPMSSFTYLQWNDAEFEKRARMFVKN